MGEAAALESSLLSAGGNIAIEGFSGGNRIAPQPKTGIWATMWLTSLHRSLSCPPIPSSGPGSTRPSRKRPARYCHVVSMLAEMRRQLQV